VVSLFSLSPLPLGLILFGSLLLTKVFFFFSLSGPPSDGYGGAGFPSIAVAASLGLCLLGLIPIRIMTLLSAIARSLPPPSGRSFGIGNGLLFPFSSPSFYEAASPEDFCGNPPHSEDVSFARDSFPAKYHLPPPFPYYILSSWYCVWSTFFV